MPRITQSWLNAYHAKTNRKSLPHVAGACEREAELHEQIFAECRRRGWIALHGAMSERTHRTAGEPDFTILRDAVYHAKSGDYIPKVLFIECKTRTGKLSPSQAAMHAHAAKLGHTVHVVRSFEEFLKLL